MGSARINLYLSCDMCVTNSSEPHSNSTRSLECGSSPVAAPRVAVTSQFARRSSAGKNGNIGMCGLWRGGRESGRVATHETEL